MFDEPRVREMLEFETRQQIEDAIGDALTSAFRWTLMGIGGLGLLFCVGLGAVLIAACIWAVRAMTGW